MIPCNPSLHRRIRSGLPREHVELALETLEPFAMLQQGMHHAVHVPHALCSCLLAHMFLCTIPPSDPECTGAPRSPTCASVRS